jgi:CheY-like chemotaxis protein/anti-sigma regulatory factor (Ser/Thr protein kinase)
MIHAAARDAAKIVRALSDFCRQKEFADVFGPVELNELIDEVVSLTQPKWKTEAAAEGHRIEVVVEQDQLPDVHGDKAGLREVLTNLVFNAVEAMPGGGTIVIRTQREEREALLSVSDNGEGMSDDVRQRCMEPFFTTRGARSTGMGLPAALGIVRRHGGALQVQSEPGAGTTVTARLPLVAAPHEVVRNSLDIPRTVPAAVRILIVDDEPLNLRFIEAALRTHGYDVDTADSGEEAVRKLGTARYALVITDWAMGGLHGGDVAAYVRQCSHGTPLILLTGLDELPPADKPLPNVSLVLHKPVGIGPLTEAVARLTRSPAPAA